MESVVSSNLPLERVEQARQAMVNFLTSPSQDESGFAMFCCRYIELLEACGYDEEWTSTIISDCLDKESNSPTQEQIDFWRSQFTQEQLETPNILPQRHREIIEWMEAARRAKLYEPEAEVWEWLIEIVAKKQRVSRDEAAVLIEDHADNLSAYRSQDGEA